MASPYNPSRPKFLSKIVNDLRSVATRSVDALSTQQSGIFQFETLSEDTCSDVIAEVENIKRYYPSASLNEDGVILNKFGFARKMTFFAQALRPLLRKLYDLDEDTLVVATQALVVKYTQGGSHKPHVDDSTFTLNICLGEWFTGGELRFLGEDGTDWLEFKHTPGAAILHRGGAVHAANALISGTRYSLVLWFECYCPMRFEKLPNDVRRHIMSYCSADALVTLSSTCQAYRTLLTTPLLMVSAENTDGALDPYYLPNEQQSVPLIPRSVEQQRKEPLARDRLMKNTNEFPARPPLLPTTGGGLDGNAPNINRATISSQFASEDQKLRTFLWRRLYCTRFPLDYPNLPMFCADLYGHSKDEYLELRYENRAEAEANAKLTLEEWRANEEDRITATFPTRDWFQFYVDATLILRRNAKCRSFTFEQDTQIYYNRKDIHLAPLERPKDLPNALARLTEFPIVSRHEERFVWSPRKCLIGESPNDLAFMVQHRRKPQKAPNTSSSRNPPPFAPTGRVDAGSVYPILRGGDPVTANSNPSNASFRGGSLRHPVPSPNPMIPMTPPPRYEKPRFFPEKKCLPRVTTHHVALYDDAQVLASEVGEFFEVHLDEAFDFTKAEDNIYYEDAGSDKR